MSTSALTAVLINRTLPRRIREGHGKFTGRINTSGQYPRHRQCAIHTRLPDFQYGIRNRFQTVQFQRTTVDQYQYDRLADFLQFFCSSSCICGSAMEEREAFSPLQVIISPKQRTTTSDQRAASNASANPSRLSPCVLQPNA